MRTGVVRPAGESVSPARLEAHVRALAENFRPRDYSNPENLDRAAAYIAQHFRQGTTRVNDQPFQADGVTYRNVIASFGPETGERIVVGAHYDAAGPFPGADDNASGVGGLLELARLLSATTPAMRVDLVAYPLEEPPHFRTPHMGSSVHARPLRSGGVRVRAMISLEMIGYFTDAPQSQGFPLPLLRLFYPTTGSFITVVGRLGDASVVRRVKRAMRRTSALPVHSINAPRAVPGIDFSDHASYWAQGYPALMITDTAFYRNPHYHSARDTPDTLDYERMAMVMEGVHGAVLQLM
ncbi:MAG: M28 family peptidase [Gemmatimonadetes bacterium]|nr:M28 family peptidase [Gemmatimonadota bacterium]